MKLSVREITPHDYDKFLSYWHDNSEEFMHEMGVDVSKIPNRENFLSLLQKVVNLPYNKKPGFILIWEDDGVAVGHSNINQIVFGEKASMHLHMWNSAKRKKGMGTEFIRLCLPHYFEKFQLKELLCEPAAKNPAPNNTLRKLGFEYVRTYYGAPGILMYDQEVNVYRLGLENFRKM